MNASVTPGIFESTVAPQAAVRFIEDIWPNVFNRPVVLSNLSYHLGCVRFDEMVLLASITRLLNPRRIFEFGTCRGRTSVNLAANADALETLYTLDLQETLNDGENIVWLPQDFGLYHTSKAERGAAFKGSAHENKIVQLKGNSMTFDFSGIDDIDLVFIDASKHYDHVLSDSQNAYRMLSGRGVIVWHDYGYADGVTEAVDKFAAAHDAEISQIHKTTLGIFTK